MLNLTGWHRIRFGRAVDVLAAVAAFKKIQGVVDAQPVGIHLVYRTPNDTAFSDQWHLQQTNGPHIHAPGAWDIETGHETIIAAVLDTGVRYFHRDLGGSSASFSSPTAA